MKYLKKIIIFSLISLFLLNACTYKKINSQNQKKFNIQEINVNGDGRTAFLIKKKVNRYSNSESNNNIIITIELSKSSDIEEKNIQNKATKYKVSLSANVIVSELNSGRELNRTFNSSQTYNVEEKYSNTLNNMRDANNALIDVLTNEIIEQLRIYFN